MIETFLNPNTFGKGTIVGGIKKISKLIQVENIVLKWRKTMFQKNAVRDKSKKFYTRPNFQNLQGYNLLPAVFKSIKILNGWMSNWINKEK